MTMVCSFTKARQQNLQNLDTLVLYRPSCALQLTTELEALQQQLFQQKQKVVSLTAQNDALQSELDSSKVRLQGEAERLAVHQQQAEAERRLRMQHADQVGALRAGLVHAGL